MKLPQSTKAQLEMSMRVMPFRRWYAALENANSVWIIESCVSMKRPNTLVRKGWTVLMAS